MNKEKLLKEVNKACNNFFHNPTDKNFEKYNRITDKFYKQMEK